jgi:UDP-N-acetylglucosamine transferase subunit ALG13
MILVTVGSTRFDALVEAVDRLAGAGVLPAGEVLAQRGNGDYQPRHIESVAYLPEIHEYYARAELVICHGGTGTVFALLRAGTPFVPVPNSELQDNHQADLLAQLEAEGLCRVCWRLDDLAERIAGVAPPPPCKPDHRLVDAVWGFALGERV